MLSYNTVQGKVWQYIGSEAWTRDLYIVQEIWLFTNWAKLLSQDVDLDLYCQIIYCLQMLESKSSLELRALHNDLAMPGLSMPDLKTLAPSRTHKPANENPKQSTSTNPIVSTSAEQSNQNERGTNEIASSRVATNQNTEEWDEFDEIEIPGANNSRKLTPTKKPKVEETKRKDMVADLELLWEKQTEILQDMTMTLLYDVNHIF